MPELAASPFLSSIAHHAADPFRLLIESVVDYAIIMLDPAGNIASWNPGAERIYGYRADEIAGRHFSCLCCEEDAVRGLPQDALRRALEEGRHELECQRVRRDGTRFNAVINVSNLKDYFDNHAGFAEVTRDISERKRAEEAIRQERDLSAAILGSLPGIYYMYDQQCRFLRWNRRFEEVTEYPAEEIERLHPLDLFHGKDKQLLADRIENVFRSGCDAIEAELVSKSGRRTPYYFNGVRAEIGGELCLLGMGIDISTQTRAQEALRETDRRLRMAATAANVGLWDWDISSNQVFFSREWKSQIGYAEDEIGCSFNEWESRVHPDDLASAMQGMQAYLADSSLPYSAEFRLRHRNGSYRWILSQASLIYGERGKPVRMLGSHVDITERRQIEDKLRQSQKLEAIGQLAAGVAHDFNNLLTVINGYSDLLLGKLRAADPTRDLLLQIHKAGLRAGTLTRQLLVFSRQQVLEPKVLNLNAIVGDVEKILLRLVGEDIALATSLSPGLGAVKADAGQIEQILVNLTVNARDAMPKGGRLTIETRNVTLDQNYCRTDHELQPGEYALLAVTDTGCGMDQATQQRVFEPFFTTKAAGKGTGLGLATVHGIVKQSRGHVAVYSEIGKGTTFKVYLPRVAEGPADSPTRSGRETMPRGFETILLAEDDDAVRVMARHILEACGYRVWEAANGADAAQLAQAHPGSIQLLISDVVMPFLGGKDLAGLIAATQPECRVLFLSGYADDALVHHGVLAGERAFLQKPFTPPSLARKVRSVLDDPR
jgi:PAS domain S-box-containing protein